MQLSNAGTEYRTNAIFIIDLSALFFYFIVDPSRHLSNTSKMVATSQDVLTTLIS